MQKDDKRPVLDTPAFSQCRADGRQRSRRLPPVAFARRRTANGEKWNLVQNISGTDALNSTSPEGVIYWIVLAKLRCNPDVLASTLAPGCCYSICEMENCHTMEAEKAKHIPQSTLCNKNGRRFEKEPNLDHYKDRPHDTNDLTLPTVPEVTTSTVSSGSDQPVDEWKGKMKISMERRNELSVPIDGNFRNVPNAAANLDLLEASPGAFSRQATNQPTSTGKGTTRQRYGKSTKPSNYLKPDATMINNKASEALKRVTPWKRGEKADVCFVEKRLQKANNAIRAANVSSEVLAEVSSCHQLVSLAVDQSKAPNVAHFHKNCWSTRFNAALLTEYAESLTRRSCLALLKAAAMSIATVIV
ncbi:hypothetical protein T02_11443 [Trichinella nativa]|uniref:Uncharacterized protein n=1 Tax=Trichinella nativa TaxID=6335 RepID=A0A0V1LFA1_9BILA|nr:hypothetical protein T02_11443 [Trichinella nativa]